MKRPDPILAAIAREHLLIPTLESRKADSLDFHNVAVWQIEAALKAAIDVGEQSILDLGVGKLLPAKHSPAPWSYDYSPYRVRREPDGIESELAAFEVFDRDGDKVFDTNEDTPAEQQEANAVIAVTAFEMAVLLRQFIDADRLATECGEWKWEHLEPIFERARKLIARIGYNVTAQENAIAIGHRFKLFREINRFPEFLVPGGVTGVVTTVDDTGVWGRMDQHLAGAEQWDNQIHWQTPEEFAEDTVPI